MQHLFDPALSAIRVAQSFANIVRIQKHVKPLNGVAVKDLIEEGRE
jgi:hypothetical protein